MVGIVIAASAATVATGAGLSIAGAANENKSLSNAGSITSAVGATTAAAAVPIMPLVVLGPIGWLVGSERSAENRYTFDCWKAVLREDSVEPSNGKPLAELMNDSRIQKITVEENTSEESWPTYVLENIWNERFRIQPVFLPEPFNQMAAHA